MRGILIEDETWWRGVVADFDWAGYEALGRVMVVHKITARQAIEVAAMWEKEREKRRLYARAWREKRRKEKIKGGV